MSYSLMDSLNGGYIGDYLEGLGFKVSGLNSLKGDKGGYIGDKLRIV